jgi:hypothetical protein
MKRPRNKDNDSDYINESDNTTDSDIELEKKNFSFNFKDNNLDKDTKNENKKDEIKKDEIKKDKENKRDEIKNNIVTRKRTNSEGDIYHLKIKERARHDEYFRKLNLTKQIDILTKENEVYNYYQTKVPLRYKILYSNLPLSIKSLIIQKIDLFEMMDPGEPEYNKQIKWFNGLSQIPFDTYISMPVNINDGNEKIQSFLQNSYEILKKTIYGQLEAKNKIMQILAQWISNPKSY